MFALATMLIMLLLLKLSPLPSVRFAAARKWATLCTPMKLLTRIQPSSISSLTSFGLAGLLSKGTQRHFPHWQCRGRCSSGCYSFWQIRFGSGMDGAGSTVWGQMLQLRTPLDNLRQHHPHEADKLQNISRGLESAGTGESHNLLSSSSVGVS
jgi:hypothetical protein